MQSPDRPDGWVTLYYPDCILVLPGSNGPCSRRTCNHHSVCVESDDFAFCECPDCDEVYAPVCGSDGAQYDSECKMRRAACERETDVAVAEEGICSECNKIFFTVKSA